MRSSTYPRFPDINILPGQYRRRFLTRLEWGLVVVLLVGLVGLYSSLMSFADAREATSRLRAEERHLVASADRLAPQIEQADKLRQEIADLQVNLEKTQEVQAWLSAQRMDWDALLSTLFVSLPPGIELTSVVKSQKQIATEGISSKGYAAIAQYYNQLKATPGVAKVTINKTETQQSKEKGSYLTFNLTVDLVGG